MVWSMDIKKIAAQTPLHRQTPTAETTLQIYQQELVDHYQNMAVR